MGCIEFSFVSDKSRDRLKIACLNFSGIAVSPFEFYTSSLGQQQVQLNRIFKSIVIQELLENKYHKQKQYRQSLVLKQFFDSIKYFDKDFKNRYCPLYNRRCGTKNGRFLNRKQFYQEWSKTQITKSPNLSEQQYLESKNNLMKFDFMIYKAIAEHVYDIAFSKLIESKPINRYLAFMQYNFTQQFMMPIKKAQSVVAFLKKHQIDVMMIQQATQQLFTLIQQKTEYRIIYGQEFSKSKNKEQITLVKSNTAILINEKSFEKRSDPKKSNLIFKNILEDKSIDKKKKQRFMIWNNSAIISIDNFIFVSVHLINKGVDLQMLKDIELLQDKFPKKYVIIGGLLHEFQTKMHTFTLKKMIRDQKRKKDKKKSEEEIEREVQINAQEYQDKLYKVLKKLNYFPDNGLNIPQISQNIRLEDLDINTDPKIKQAKIKLNIHTVHKKRTKMQVQLSKADTSAKQCHSYIIYDKRVQLDKQQQKGTQSVLQVTSKNLKANYNKEKIPSNEHPFDDFIVVKTIKIPKKLPRRSQTVNEHSGLQNYFDSSSSDEDVDLME